MSLDSKGKTSRRLWLAGRITGITLLFGGALFALWARSTLPQTAGEMKLAGVSGQVEIFRDANGVPHIFAGNANDAYFALGYVHAQDRLWQMEFTRRLGAGRLAEVVGDAGLGADRFLRTLGLYHHAEIAAARLSEPARGALGAYAAGVNAWLQHGHASLPPEFILLNYEPEPWTVADSIVWGQLLAYQLSTNWQGELYRAGLRRKLPQKQIAQLWPGDPPDAPVTLDAARRAAMLDVRALLAEVPPELRSFSASNAWVLSGERTMSGKPILANDPHLGFTLPNTWYLARIDTPDMSVAGATAPGVPFVILGHNGHVAWGMTSTGGDTQDLFVETVAPSDPARYVAPGGTLPFGVREEVIRVKGGNDVGFTVRTTRHGPVVSDVLDDSRGLAGEGTVLALASASDGPGDETIEALAEMPNAKTSGQFERIAAGFQAPLINIFFADREGEIGFVTPGLVPVRRAGDGRYPVDGASGDYDWTGFVPSAEMPRIVDPAAGFLVNANNRLVGPHYPYMITRNWDNPYRAERINEMVKGTARHSVEDTMREQGDILSAAARQLVPRMLAATREAPDARSQKALGMLRDWDYRMKAGRPEPLIYMAWLRQSVKRIAGDELGDELAGYWRPRPTFVRYVLDGGSEWCASDCTDEMRAALSDALNELSGLLGSDMSSWQWGKLHQARFENRVLSQIPLLGGIVGMLTIPTGGGDNTVGRGMTAGNGDAPYAHIHGAGYKAVYDLDDLDNSRFMIPVGQSGNPFSGHYSDLLEPWRDGRYFRIAGSRDALAAGADRLLLVPADQ